MLYDDVLKIVGEFGRYQKTVILTACLVSLTSGPTQLISIFNLASPRHRCAIPGYDNDTYYIQNTYHGNLINQSIPESTSCLLRNQTVDEYGNVTSHEYKCESWVFDQSEYSSTFVTEFNLVCDYEVYKTNAVMILFLGLLIGYGTLSSFADIFGRRPLYIISNVVFVACTHLLIWTPNYIFLLSMRFMLGLSMSGQVLSFYIIGLELVGPNKRMYAAMSSFFSWSAGIFILDAMAYWIRNWRYLQVAVAIYSSFTLLLFKGIPESPRWLLTRGHNSKAKKTILKIAEVNKVELKQDIIKGITVSDKITKVKFWRIFTSRRLCLRTITIYYVWFAASITYYGILLNLNLLPGNVHLNLLVVAVMEVVTYVCVSITTDRIGRRNLVCGCFVLATVTLTSTIFVILYAPKDLSWLMAVLAIIGRFGVAAAFCILWFWTGELFPTELRNTGTGTSSAMARVGSIVAPYIGLMNKNISGDFGRVSAFVVYSCVCVSALILTVLVLPDTSRMHLPETINHCKLLGQKDRKDTWTKDEIESKIMLEKESTA